MKVITSSYTPYQAHAIIDALNVTYPNVPGVALLFPLWVEIFDHDLNIIPPVGHILDILIICQDLSLHLWACFSDAHISSSRDQRKDYAFEVCRLLKRYLLNAPLDNTQHTPLNLHIKPHLFIVEYKDLNSFTKSDDTFHEQYQSYLTNMEGVSMDAIRTRLINSTVSKIVWLRGRINQDITYHLTQQQCEAFLQFCNDQILMVEAAPGCGKSVMAAYICQRFGGPSRRGDVLYICPRKGFAAIVKHQGNADTCVAHDENTMKQVIQKIKHGKHKVIVVDDLQAMSCQQSVWTRLLEAAYGKARLLLLMDSEFQDFYSTDSCSSLRLSVEKFSLSKRIARKSCITLTTNLRNSRKVFSFLIAQLEGENNPSCHGEFTCGHKVEGDDVYIRVIANPWDDSPVNALVQLVSGMIQQKGDHVYEATDIVVLIDDRNNEAATRLRSIISHQSNIVTCQACDVPHVGVVVDLVDEFIGMEAPVCVVIIPRGSEGVNNMRYRIFSASRGIMRTDLVFMDDFNAELANPLAITDMTGATESQYTPEIK